MTAVGARYGRSLFVGGYPATFSILGDRFGYTFDFGDSWRHDCVTDADEIDPEKLLGIIPSRPLSYWESTIPDPAAGCSTARSMRARCRRQKNA